MLDEVVQSDTERPFDNQREGKVMQRRGLFGAVNCREGKEVKFPLGGALHTVIIALCAFVLCGCPHQVQAQVPVTLAPVVKQQLFDQNGVVLSGGLVCTYQSGTTTPQATYTDYTGTVQNTNPVVLDSSGRANIWLIGAAYKIVVAGGGSCASPSNLQYTVDGVPAGVFLNGNNSWTGNETHSGTETFTGPLVTTDGGTLNGTFAGSPNFSGSVNFSGSASFSGGLSSTFFSSSSSNPAATGLLRLESSDSICWRNNANSADLCMSKSAGDVFSVGTHIFAFTDIGQTFTGANTFSGLTTFSNPSSVGAEFNGNIRTDASSIVSQYNGLPTASNGVAVTRDAPPSKTAQTADTTLASYTTETNPLGLYLVAGYEVLTRAATMTSFLPYLEVTYTDLDSNTPVTIIFADNNGDSCSSESVNTVGATCSGSIVISAKGGTTIQIGNTGYMSAGATSMQYAFRGNIVAF